MCVRKLRVIKDKALGRLKLRGRTGSNRVLRGGAFNNNQRNVRCAYRNRNNPNNTNNNNGFRVVVAHDFLCWPEMPGGRATTRGRFYLPGRGVLRKPARSVPGRALGLRRRSSHAFGRGAGGEGTGPGE